MSGAATGLSSLTSRSASPGPAQNARTTMSATTKNTQATKTVSQGEGRRRRAGDARERALVRERRCFEPE